MMWGNGSDYWIMGLMMLLFWGPLIGITVWAVMRMGRPTSDPRKVLEDRLVNGEIDVKEFEDRRALLSR